MDSSFDAKRIKFIKTILKYQMTAQQTTNGVEFKQGGQIYELLRQNGVSSSRSSLN
jgi:hypothetical protein